VWAAELHLEILGTSFVVRATDPEHLDVVVRMMGPFIRERSARVPSRRTYGLVRTQSSDGTVLAYRDCRRLGPTGLPAAALSRLVASLNRESIELYAGFAVHSGVVSIDSGAVAFPLPSGGGKSTLTAACVAAGFGYVSDEALCIDPDDGTVLPYAKPLALDRHSRELLSVEPSADWSDLGGGQVLEDLYTPADLGGSTVTEPLGLRHVVIAHFDHDELELREAAHSEAMTHLLSQSFNHYKNGLQAFKLAAELARHARMWRLAYSTPAEAAALLRDRLC
jgi:hypothetical protein